MTPTIAGRIGKKILGLNRGLRGSDLPYLPHDPLVMVNYFEWFVGATRQQWDVYAPLGHAWMPKLGEYTSSDLATIREHIAQFKRAGVDGASLDYWGTTSAFSLDATLQTVLDEWEKNNIRYCVLYEPQSIINGTLLGRPQALANLLQPGDPRLGGTPVEYNAGPVWLRYVLNPTTGRFRDNYIWCQDRGGAWKPMLLLFDNAMDEDANYVDGDHENKSEANGAIFDLLRQHFFVMSADLNQFTARHFDGGYLYNPIFQDPAGNPAAPQYRAKQVTINGFKGTETYAKALFMATVIPGYNDSGENKDSGWVTPTGNERGRANGTFYDRYWRLLTEACPLTDMVYITSFNEHGEGSGIEEQSDTVHPSWTLSFGADYLDRTRVWAEWWRKLKLSQGRRPPRYWPNEGVAR